MSSIGIDLIGQNLSKIKNKSPILVLTKGLKLDGRNLISMSSLLKKYNKNLNISEPFKNLFTQGMVCHESYQDDKGNWLYPDEVKRIDSKTVIKKKDKTVVKVGPAESMSKSKKNTIDPEKMIETYGADAVRLFILSDSPPEKDIQWSEQGMVASYKIYK